MVLRNVAKTFSLEEQRQEINEIAVDLDAVNTTLTNWNASQWDTAYGWGDHAQAGYWVDNSTSRTNWDTAYGWGDHGTAGYITAEVDTLASVTNRGATTNDTIVFGDTSNAGEFRLSLESGDYLKVFGSSGETYIRNDDNDIGNTSTNINIQGRTGVALWQSTGNLGLLVDSNCAVNLYYSTSKKLETTTNGVTVTGDISVSGTVDGRDLATDGTKLDGIESGATADQTDAEIKTAYENNADTNAFTDAEQTKLAGIADGAEVNLAPGGTFSGAGTNADPAIGSIQFKNTGNTFGGDSLFTYDNTNNKLSIGVSSGNAALNVVRPGATSVDTAYFYASTNGSDNRILINTVANQGGNPFIRFDSGGSNMIVGQLWAGTTNNKLVLGVGETPSGVTGIAIDGLGNVTANNLALSQTNTSVTGASATSTVLDHYEEGTWTPIIDRLSTSPTTATYTYNTGKYTRIGNVVTVYFDMTISALGGGSGRFVIAGLPFATSTDSSSGGYGSPQFRNSTAFSVEAQERPSSYHSNATINLRYTTSTNGEDDITVGPGRITGWSVYFTS